LPEEGVVCAVVLSEAAVDLTVSCTAVVLLLAVVVVVSVEAAPQPVNNPNAITNVAATLKILLIFIIVSAFRKYYQFFFSLELS